MIREVLEAIEGVGFYPAVSLVMFFVAFVIVVIRIITTDRNEMEMMRRMPLDDPGTAGPEGERNDG